MPLTKAEYEKALKRKLTDAQYESLSGVSIGMAYEQQSRPDGAYAGAEPKTSLTVTPEPGGSGYLPVRDRIIETTPSGDYKYGDKIVSGATVGKSKPDESKATPLQDTVKGAGGVPLSSVPKGAVGAQPIDKPGYLSNPLPNVAKTSPLASAKAGEQVYVGDNAYAVKLHNTAPGKQGKAGDTTMAKGGGSLAGLVKPTGVAPAAPKHATTYDGGMTNTPGKVTAASAAAAIDDLPERAVDATTDAADDLGEALYTAPGELYARIVAANRKKMGM